MLLHNRIPVSRRFASRPLPPPPSPSSTSQPHQQPSTVGLTVLCVLGGAFVAVSTPSLTLLFQIVASTCLFSSSLLPCPQPGVASSSSGQQQSRFYTGIIVQPSVSLASLWPMVCDRAYLRSLSVCISEIVPCGPAAWGTRGVSRPITPTLLRAQ